MKIDFKAIHQQVSLLMPQVNDLLLEKFTRPKKIAYKASGIDHLGTSVVTEVDKQTEAILKQKLPAILPGSGFIGEETEINVQEYNWIIDPIDGTLNYANQVPVFACSIGLWHKNEPVYAYVSLPLTQETLHAIAGEGIWLNDKPVTPAKKTTKKIFLTYSCVGDSQLQSRVFNAVLQFTSSPRFYGSCVFHGAQIALGRIGGGGFMNKGAWGIAAS